MGNKANLCELCGVKCKAFIKIFGCKGVQLSIKSIVFQHFSIELTETDKDSKIICKKCWKITNNFHQLYCLVKKLITDFNYDNKSEIRLEEFQQTVHNDDSIRESSEVDVEVKLESFGCNLFNNHIHSSSKPMEVPIKDEYLHQYLDNNILEDHTFKLDQQSELITRKKTARKELTEKQLQTIEQDEAIYSSLGFVCELCSSSYTSFLELNKHFRKKHKMVGYIRCCERKYKIRSVLYNHIKNHKNPVRLKCSVCVKTFIHEASLKLHLKRHDPASKKIKCPNCPKLFPNNSNLNKHFEWVHFTGPKSFLCDICGKGYMTKTAITCHLLAVHVRKHSQICDSCGRTFKTIQLLEAHNNKKHLGIQLPKVQCHVCNAWLSDNKTLRKHVRYHYVKEETCPTCGKKAPNRNALCSHIRKVHSGLIFSCTMCNKNLKTKKSLMEHISIHTGYNLYRCKYCDMEFKYESSLYKHRKDVHLNEWEEDVRRKDVIQFNPIKKVDSITE